MYDVVVVGAGIVGLAVAYTITERMPGCRVAVVEKESVPARHQTGNNSGVLHSGIYYKPGSEKARNCRRGYALMLDFCQRHDVAYELCGKLIVATEEPQLAGLNTIYERGVANGLEGLSFADSHQIRQVEPHATGLRAIHVPMAGITDYRAVAEAMARAVQASGGAVHYGRRVTGLREGASSAVLTTDGGSYEAGTVINCGGLYSDVVAGFLGTRTVRILPFRGEYYELAHDATHLVRGLLYPVPDPSFPFLGVHFTKKISGGVEAGPNAVLALAREGYSWADVDLGEVASMAAFPGLHAIARRYWRTGLAEMYRSLSKAAFTKALQALVPEVRAHHLVRGGAGVRAQACDRHGNLLDDFVIEKTPRTIHVVNAPSPAATSSLAIAETVVSML